MNETQQILEKVKFSASKSLTRLVLKALDDARLQIEAQALRFVSAEIPPLTDEAPKLAERFMLNLHGYFDELTTLTVKDREIASEDYDNLSLVDQDYLEAIIAMEGMVKHIRRHVIEGYRSYGTRLEHMLPHITIDECNNPLDPEQVGDSFNEAIRPLGLKAHYLLTIYREFNKTVFGNYADVISDANAVLIEAGVLPDLDITARERAARKQKREEIRARLEAEDTYKEQSPPAPRGQAAPSSPGAAPQPGSERFTLMQSLVNNVGEKSRGGVPLITTAPNASALIADQIDLRKQHEKLMSMLTDIQHAMLQQVNKGNGSAPMQSAAIGQSLNDALQAETESGELAPLNGVPKDVLNLILLLYEAIWSEDTLPVAIKELIGRTQISMMKVALGDTGFFDNEQHPGRLLLNELALAGIARTVSENADSDPVYAKIKSLVERLLAEEEPGNEFLQQLVNELSDFTAEQTGTDAALERKLRETSNMAGSVDDVHAYVSQKVNERILKGKLDPFIRTLLNTHLHEFLVKLLLREGPGGPSWKPVMSTIDVLLWTVQAEKQPGDRERFERINPRLLDNLQKAMLIGGASKTKISRAIRQLKQIQEYTFHMAKDSPTVVVFPTGADELLPLRNMRDATPLPKDDPEMLQIEKLPVGAWLEFYSANGKTVRCELVARIESIDKLLFANKVGKKVGEVTRTRLAHELKAGSAKIVSSGTLMGRAMESVLKDLKICAQLAINEQREAKQAAHALPSIKVDYLN